MVKQVSKSYLWYSQQPPEESPTLNVDLLSQGAQVKVKGTYESKGCFKVGQKSSKVAQTGIV